MSKRRPQRRTTIDKPPKYTFTDESDKDDENDDDGTLTTAMAATSLSSEDDFQQAEPKKIAPTQLEAGKIVVRRQTAAATSKPLQPGKIVDRRKTAAAPPASYKRTPKVKKGKVTKKLRRKAMTATATVAQPSAFKPATPPPPSVDTYAGKYLCIRLERLAMSSETIRKRVENAKKRLRGDDDDADDNGNSESESKRPRQNAQISPEENVSQAMEPIDIGDVELDFANFSIDEQQQQQQQTQSSKVSELGQKDTRKNVPKTPVITEFIIEYAPSSVKKCNVCKKQIMVNEIRIRKAETETADLASESTQHYHGKCFSQKRSQLGWSKPAHQMAGFGELSEEHQQLIGNEPSLNDARISLEKSVRPPQATDLIDQQQQSSKGSNHNRHSNRAPSRSNARLSNYQAASAAPQTRIIDFRIEIAPTSMVACDICKAKIIEKEIRVHKVVKCSANDTVVKKYHVQCFGQKRWDLGWFEKSADKMKGFKDLSQHHQKLVRQIVEDEPSPNGNCPVPIKEMEIKAYVDLTKDFSSREEKFMQQLRENQRINDDIIKSFYEGKVTKVEPVDAAANEEVVVTELDDDFPAATAATTQAMDSRGTSNEGQFPLVANDSNNNDGYNTKGVPKPSSTPSSKPPSTAVSSKQSSTPKQSSASTSTAPAKRWVNPSIEQFEFDYEQAQFPEASDGEGERWYRFDEVKHVCEGLPIDVLKETYGEDFSFERYYNDGKKELLRVFPGMKPSNSPDTKGNPKIYSGRATSNELTHDTDQNIGQTEKRLHSRNENRTKVWRNGEEMAFVTAVRANGNRAFFKFICFAMADRKTGKEASELIEQCVFWAYKAMKLSQKLLNAIKGEESNRKPKSTKKIPSDLLVFKVGLFILMQLIGSKHVPVQYKADKPLKHPEFSYVQCPHDNCSSKGQSVYAMRPHISTCHRSEPKKKIQPVKCPKCGTERQSQKMILAHYKDCVIGSVTGKGPSKRPANRAARKKPVLDEPSDDEESSSSSESSDDDFEEDDETPPKRQLKRTAAEAAAARAKMVSDESSNDVDDDEEPSPPVKKPKMDGSEALDDDFEPNDFN